MALISLAVSTCSSTFQDAVDATLSTFLTDFELVFDATLSTWSYNFKHVFDATLERHRKARWGFQVTARQMRAFFAKHDLKQQS